MENTIVIASGTSYESNRAVLQAAPGADLRPRVFRPVEGVFVRGGLFGAVTAHPLTDPTQDLASVRTT